jgi:hypothetical protein
MGQCWKNIVEPDRPQMTVWRKTITCCITKATNTHLEYAILMAFPLQQWLHERASMLSFIYIACIVEPCSNPFLWNIAILLLWNCGIASLTSLTCLWPLYDIVNQTTIHTTALGSFSSLLGRLRLSRPAVGPTWPPMHLGIWKICVPYN